MFLCKTCHEASGCWVSKDGIGFMLERESHGRCECCGEVHNCADCHGYDFRKNPDHVHEHDKAHADD